MNKILGIFALCAFLFAGVSGGEAAFVSSPQATSSAEKVTSVEVAKTLPDDAKVVLQGTIEKPLRKEHYLFRDETGSVTVEIDDDVWRGLIVTPEDTVRLHGEIDRDASAVKVEIDHIAILKKP